MSSSERGQTLVETVVAVALLAIATAAIVGGTIAATRHFGPDPTETAMQEALAREMRIAVDIVKYQQGTIAPNTIATTIPMPSSSPIAVRMSIATAAAPGGGTAVTITASTTSGQTKSATLTTSIASPAPLPYSKVPSGLTVAAPTGAPGTTPQP